MEQVDMEASSSRTMENRCLVNLFEFIGNKHLIKKKKKKISKCEQTEPEHHKKMANSIHCKSKITDSC